MHIILNVIKYFLLVQLYNYDNIIFFNCIYWWYSDNRFFVLVYGHIFPVPEISGLFFCCHIATVEKKLFFFEGASRRDWYINKKKVMAQRKKDPYVIYYKNICMYAYHIHWGKNICWFSDAEIFWSLIGLK